MKMVTFLSAITQQVHDILDDMIERIATLLYLSGEPISCTDMARILETDVTTLYSALDEVEKHTQPLGLHVLRNGDMVSMVTDVKQAPLVEQFWKEELKGELTPATLQVLTIIAYLENPTRQVISYIRGVQSSQSIRTLAVRGLIKREGEVCTLTSDALKQLGITRVEELPQYDTIRKDLTEKMKTLDL